MLTHHFYRTLQLCVLVLVLFSAGCSRKDVALVEGVVTYNGDPIESGLIVFQPNQGRTAGAPIVNGKYSLEVLPGAMPGENKVKVTWLKKTGEKYTPPPPSPPGIVVEVEEQVIPPKYNTETTLVTSLKPGRNVYDLALEK
jgi:hypothetical protein